MKTIEAVSNTQLSMGPRGANSSVLPFSAVGPFNWPSRPLPLLGAFHGGDSAIELINGRRTFHLVLRFELPPSVVILSLDHLTTCRTIFAQGPSPLLEVVGAPCF